MMNRTKQGAKRLLSLISCTALLIPALPAASAAAGLFHDSFDSYADQTALRTIWAQAGSTTANQLQLSTDRAVSGGCSLLREDTEADQSMQARALVSNSGAKGTEIILTAQYYVESMGTSGKTPTFRSMGPAQYPTPTPIPPSGGTGCLSFTPPSRPRNSCTCAL